MRWTPSGSSSNVRASPEQVVLGGNFADCRLNQPRQAAVLCDPRQVRLRITHALTSTGKNHQAFGRRLWPCVQYSGPC